MNGQKMSEQPIYIALGANLPFGRQTPQETLVRAIQSLQSQDVAVIAVSSFWASPAWPDPSKPGYVNAVAEVVTEKPAIELLNVLQATEVAFGRERNERWDSRTLDLDILDYRGEAMDSERLQLPHPRMAKRAFVLLPLQEISPDWKHPVSGEQISDLVARLDPGDIEATHRLT